MLLLGLGLSFFLVGDGSDDTSTTLIGTDGDDQIRADVGSLLDGLGGNDTLNGSEEADVLLGRGGDDLLNAQGGDDRVEGGDGRDDLNGDAGNDELFGNSGNDTLNGGRGDDDLIDAVAEPLFSRPDQASTLFGGDGDDTLLGDDGDVLTGDAGIDTFKVYSDGIVDPVVITDFEISNEILEINAIIPSALNDLGPSSISFEQNADGTSLNAVLNTPDGASVVVAVLNNISVITVPVVALNVSTF
ncbi:hypothetical protein KUL25_16815 [Rhodobacteraceae bacterium N5(2021)]|uniref:Calcium-binding protein n=1 Tax=Gymnodinialimonas phycosphaerae TaxID=2841589 RepID=A0A975YF90_9RHOB|nr:hypothetical protein [Gymnodinialimonas phycosphaerae]MBY4894420.1 hypothetical protein [Gymnodinialimonas phycosphaerae]